MEDVEVVRQTLCWMVARKDSLWVRVNFYRVNCPRDFEPEMAIKANRSMVWFQSIHKKKERKRVYMWSEYGLVWREKGERLRPG